jgi:Uncharacterized conserved protein
MDTLHEGGCACGAVRYRTRGAPVRAGICHCRYCQLRSGSAFGISVYFAEDKVELLSGTLTDYAFQTESDRSFRQRFCPACGTSVFWSLEVFPGLTGVAGGTFDPPTFWYDVRREVFARSRAAFVALSGITDSSGTAAVHAPILIEAPARRGG